MSNAARILIPAALLAALTACGNDRTMMTGPTISPNAVTGSGETVSLLSLSPAGGSVGVSVGAQIVIHFSHGMGTGMEMLVLLHQGDVSGPTVPMSYGWSADRSTLICTPAAPLMARTRYTIHMGGGMTDANGHNIDWDDMPMMGGQWVGPGMMPGGMSPSMMGPGWQGSNGAYGAMFTFTTA